MIYIKALPPYNNNFKTWVYTRYGVVIPKEETEYKSIKELFPDSQLSEEALEIALRNDKRISINNESEKIIQAEIEKEERKVEIAIETKTKKENKKNILNKKIEKFNKEKEKALETETKEDDKIIEEKEKELMKEIKEANDGQE